MLSSFFFLSESLLWLPACWSGQMSEPAFRPVRGQTRPVKLVLYPPQHTPPQGPLGQHLPPWGWAPAFSFHSNPNLTSIPAFSMKLFPNRIRERQGLVGLREHLGRSPHFMKSEVFSELPQVTRSLESICSVSLFLLCSPAHPSSDQAGFVEILGPQPESMQCHSRQAGIILQLFNEGNLVSPLFCFCFCF